MVALLTALLAFGCSDDDNSTGGNNNTTPEIPSVMENINVPTENLAGSGNIYGTQAAMYVAMAQAYSSFLTPPPTSVAKHDGPSLALSDSVTYSWSNGQLSIIMTWQETSTEYIWICQLDGYDESSETTFDHFTFIECHELLNGSSGWMELYDPDQTGAVLRWDWTEVEGVFTMTLTMVDGSDTATIVIKVYANGSGYVEYTVVPDNGDYWKITWNAAGTSGEWFTDTESGTWTYSG
ncbi:MAG: hypothetical protein DRP47_00115 [Candidatus Zixiibacteriota bacterium]|nr:MAG: hypothetical protein DRP47_00115 [candidate division Zixibacteria bacterium]